MKNFVDLANANGLLHESKQEVAIKETVYNLLKDTPIYPDRLLDNLTLFLNPKTLGRILFYNEMYKKILDIPGIIMEFGVNWGGVFRYSAHSEEFMNLTMSDVK